MKISVVIPTYNRGDIISKSLDSISNQTYPDWEIVVVDNASTDNTAEVMQRYTTNPKIRYVVNDRNYERSYSRNRGMSLATGDFVTLLDSTSPFLIFSIVFFRISSDFSKLPTFPSKSKQYEWNVFISI